MKGQFMMISAVVVGIIVISIGSVISETQSKEFSNTDTAYQINSIREEASKIDMASPKERENFQKLVEMISYYRTDTRYWSKKQCFNVTLIRSDERINLECID